LSEVTRTAYSKTSRLVDFGKAEAQLAVIVTFAQRQFALDPPPQDHDAAIPASCLKPQAAILWNSVTKSSAKATAGFKNGR
jgi:hypothetical protein